MLEVRGRPSSPPSPRPEVRGRSPSLEGEDAGSLRIRARASKERTRVAQDKGPEGEDAGSLEDKGPSLEREDGGVNLDKETQLRAYR